MVAVLLDGVGVVVEEEVDVLLRPDDRLALGVLELLAGSGRRLGVVADLLDDLADVRESAAFDVPHGPDADLARAVAAQDAAILDEGDLAPHAGCGDRRADSRVAAADDDEVVARLRRRIRGKTQLIATPLAEDRGVFRRAGLAHREVDRVATAVEAGEVVEGDLRPGRRRDVDGAGIVPVPVGPLGAERLGERLAVHEDLELAGRPRRLPAGDPIVRPDPDAVLAGVRELDGRGRVLDRDAEAVGEEVWRSHRLDELRVEAPASSRGCRSSRLRRGPTESEERGQSREGRRARGPTSS